MQKTITPICITRQTVHKTQFFLDKIDFNNVNEVLNIAKVLTQNFEKVPTLTEGLTQIIKYANKLQYITKITTNKQIAQSLTNGIDKVLTECNQYIDNANKFTNGLYKVVLNNEIIGLFGIKIEKTTDGKIQHFSLQSFLKPTTTQQDKLLQQGIGSDIVKGYYQNIVLSNKEEFASNATFEIKFVSNNKDSTGFQKNLCLTKYTAVKQLNENCSITLGTIDGFLNSINDFLNQGQNKQPLPKL